MWELRNLTPYAAERQFLRDVDGAEVWTVAVRAAFDLCPDGATRVSEQQVDVRRSPAYTGRPGASSLLEETDFTLPKPAVDVLVRGHACMPDEAPGERLNIAVTIGGYPKTAVVVGDRVWERHLGHLVASAPQPFRRMPVTYEHAFGGADLLSDRSGRARLAENPVGKGFGERAEHLVDRPLPNIECAAHPIAAWNQRPKPVGFGPIARDWEPRAALAGTYDERWFETRRPLWPTDLSPRFHQCAPVDQQIEGLRGGEPISLAGFSPTGPIRFRLPRVALGVRTRLGNETVEQRATLSTVIVDADAMQVVLVFASHLRCHGRDHEVLRTTIWEKEIVSGASL
ncbi:DUF2169 family type VI secretion system accessory protein [Sorangium sp. So ce542]|uniref:DUF2169 family type VI secretion system accessory protein n=1 Tax=Sorangium sp. So ce542 TaxID=3133316 RepID=UPI003F60D5ED